MKLTFALFLLFALGRPVAAAEPSVDGLRRSLVQAISKQDSAGTIAAVKGLIAAGKPGAEVILGLLPRLPAEAGRSYWILLDGLAAFRDPGSYSLIGDAVLKYRRAALGQDLLVALGRCRSRFVNRVVRRVLEAGTPEMKLAALGIASRIPVRRTVDILLDALEREIDRPRGDLKDHIIHVLVALTGNNYGEAIVNWRGWWQKNRAKGVVEIKRESRSTRTVVDNLDPIREKEFLGLEKRPPGFVLVITASPKEIAFDHIEKILEQMGIPHKVVTKEEASDPKFTFAGVRVIAINCMMWREYCRNPDHKPDNTHVAPRLRRCVGPGEHIMRGYAFSGAAIEKLKTFVERGGYLFTEDMVLEELLSKAWGKFVGVGDFLPEKNVEIRCARGMGSHPYLRGVFTSAGPYERDAFGEEKAAEEYDIPESAEDDEKDDRPTIGRTGVVEKPEMPEDGKIEIDPVLHHWKIDEDSPSITINDTRKVLPLMTSEGLAAKGSSAVALTFRPGGASSGSVLHVLSHFGKQKSESDEFALQNILLNFILEAHARAPAPPKAAEPEKK
ncbi:MAG: hypothetical protein JXP34_12910 [Planctomycetes bacterium]|nr:hypothetical protein [Planctomycetota bacterium]